LPIGFLPEVPARPRLRRDPNEVRKATLKSVLRGCRLGLQFNQHLTPSDEVIFRHTCKMGLNLERGGDIPLP
jgi:hypothetical protein